MKSVFSIGLGCHCQTNYGLIMVTSLLALAAIAWELMVWLQWLLYWLWWPLTEKWWFDYSDFSIGFGCHCLRTDGLIIVTSLLALVAIDWELMVWLQWLLCWFWLPLPEKWRFDYSDLSIGFGCHCLRTDGLIIVTSLLTLAAIAWGLTVWL